MMPTGVGVPDSGMGRNTTFRVQGLPAGIVTDDAASIIAQLFDADFFKCAPTVHCLGPDPYHHGRSVDMVATVTFGRTPPPRSPERWRSRVYTNSNASRGGNKCRCCFRLELPRIYATKQCQRLRRPYDRVRFVSSASFENGSLTPVLQVVLL